MRTTITALIGAAILAGPACSQTGQTAVPVPTTVEAAYRQALQTSPLPRDVEAEQRDWIASRADADDDSGHLDRLRRRLADDRRARTLRVRPENLEKSCLSIGLDGCTPLSGGFLMGGDDFTLYWQVQDGYTEEDGVGGGVVVLERRGTAGPLVPLVWTSEGAAYEAPILTRVEEEEWLLILPGVSRGNGAGDMMRMMVFRDGLWRQVDTDWQSRAGAQLAGLEVRHRPFWTFHDGIRAVTPLWRPSDPGCCGQAGTALLQFQVAGDRLNLIDLKRLGEAD